MRWKKLVLAAFAVATAGILMGAGKWYDTQSLGGRGFLFFFDSSTIAAGDILQFSGVSASAPNDYNKFRVVRPPSVTLTPQLEGRWSDFVAQPAQPSEDVSARAGRATIVYDGTSNHDYQHAQVFTFSASAEQFLDSKIKLPACLADSGPITISYFWSEQSGETGKKALWKFQYKALAAGESVNSSPTYLTVQGNTANTSLTVKETQFVSTVSALGWDENDIVYMQIGRAAAAADDDAAASNLHHVSIEVPVVALRE